MDSEAARRVALRERDWSEATLMRAPPEECLELRGGLPGVVVKAEAEWTLSPVPSRGEPEEREEVCSTVKLIVRSNFPVGEAEAAEVGDPKSAGRS